MYWNTVMLLIVYLMTFSVAQFIKRRMIGRFVSNSLETTWMETVAEGIEENHEKMNSSLTHGAEPFLRSCQLCSYSRTSQHFMENEFIGC
jgi:hypothetical protein